MKKTAGRQTEELAIADIRFDWDTYQRQGDNHHIAKIVRTFDNDLFGPATVVMRLDGSFWAVDGQQRLTALRALEYTHAWCTVIPSRDPAHEAWLFTQLNSIGKRVKAKDVHKANVAWGEQIALAIEEVLAEFGLTAKYAAKSREISAVTALRLAWGNASDYGADYTHRPKEMQFGKDVLRWVITCGVPLLEKGESARDVFQGTVLGALIWMRRNAIEVADASEVALILAPSSSLYLRRITLGSQEDEVTSSDGAYGGSRRNLWGRNLATWINTRHGRPLIVLPPVEEAA